jgi:hypothetical protein
MSGRKRIDGFFTPRCQKVTPLSDRGMRRAGRSTSVNQVPYYDPRLLDPHALAHIASGVRPGDGRDVDRLGVCVGDNMRSLSSSMTRLSGSDRATQGGRFRNAISECRIEAARRTDLSRLRQEMASREQTRNDHR